MAKAVLPLPQALVCRCPRPEAGAPWQGEGELPPKAQKTTQALRAQGKGPDPVPRQSPRVLRLACLQGLPVGSTSDRALRSET